MPDKMKISDSVHVRLTVPPAFTMLRISISRLSVLRDSRTALISGCPALGTHHSMGVPSAFNSPHPTAL